MKDNTLSILLVEDNPAHVELVRRAYEDGECKCELNVCANIADAISFIKKTKPDVVVTDLNLPGGRGTDLISIEGVYKYPVILMTSFGDESIAVEAIKAGAMDYMVKSPESFIKLPSITIRVMREWRYIIEKENAQENLALKQREQASILDAMHDAVLCIDNKGNILTVNNAAVDMFGYDKGYLLNGNIIEIMPGEHDEHLPAHINVSRFIESGRISITGGVTEITAMRSNGETFPIRVSIAELPKKEEQIASFVTVCQDITDRKKAEILMNHLAHHDNLTGLPNRLLFSDRLQQVMKAAHRSEKLVAVIFLDLDHFKNINDSMGHDAGDSLLKDVAQRLIACVRETDTVARLGGDEFTLVLSSINHVDNIVDVVKKIIKKLSSPFQVKSTEVFITVSVGVTIYPLDDDNADDLIRDADTAMYFAKEKGRNNFQFYNHKMRQRVEEKLKLEGELRQALVQNEFVLFYQPKIDTENNTVVGMEALIRWQHPERGLVAPDDFIGAAEETGLIIPIGKWVLEEACKHTKILNASGIAPIHVSVNLSVRQLEGPGLLQLIDQTLKDTKLDPALLDLEITESMLMSDMNKAIKTLNNLSSLGVTISVDDFGIGHSSLSYLKQFPITTLKIDRSFICNIPEDKDDMSITIAIIQMADALGLQTVAEGVETKQQLAFLNSYSCNLIQGYYFSKPIAFNEIEKLFQEGRGKDNRVIIHPAA